MPGGQVYDSQTRSVRLGPLPACKPKLQQAGVYYIFSPWVFRKRTKKACFNGSKGHEKIARPKKEALKNIQSLWGWACPQRVPTWTRQPANLTPTDGSKSFPDSSPDPRCSCRSRDTRPPPGLWRGCSSTPSWSSGLRMRPRCRPVGRWATPRSGPRPWRRGQSCRRRPGPGRRCCGTAGWSWRASWRRSGPPTRAGWCGFPEKKKEIYISQKLQTFTPQVKHNHHISNLEGRIPLRISLKSRKSRKKERENWTHPPYSWIYDNHPCVEWNSHYLYLYKVGALLTLGTQLLLGRWP